MKKYLNSILSMAALLMASATVFTACSNDDDIIGEQPAASSQQTYTMTINASKGGDATTRALSLDGKALNATWAEGDKVKVYNSSNAEIGELTAETSGASTKLKGDLSTLPTDGETLTLKFLSPSYASQNGTIERIAANCDYATATVTATVSGSEVTATDANFENKQAIVKFTLIDKTDGTTPLSASQLVINDGTTDYTINPTLATSEIYAAIPGFTGKTVTLTATVGGDTYTYEKSGVSFTNGQYYEITVKMTKQAIPVTAITLNKTETSIKVGSTETLSVTAVAPDNATDKTYTWKTSDATKATVDQDGKVTAVAEGTVTIYAEANDGSGVKGNCTVTVTPAISFNKVDWVQVGKDAPANFISVSQTDAKAAADAEKTRANAPGYVCIYAYESGQYKWIDSHGRTGQKSNIQDIANADAINEVSACDAAGYWYCIWFTVSQ